MPVGLLVVDGQGIIQLVNKKAENMFAIAASEFLGKPLESVLVARTRSFAQIKEDILLQGGQIEIDAAKSYSETFPVELSLHEFPVQEQVCFLATVMDITERRALQQFKRELIAMVSHDLSAPLSSIEGTLNLLSTKSVATLTERGADLVGRAQRNAGRLIKLVDNLLTIERLESGKFELNLELVSIDSLCQSAIEMVKDQADRKSILLSAEPCYADAILDPGRIEQVIVNLLSNAIKFSPQQSTIKIFVQDADRAVRICVTDSGRGVPKEDQLRVFDRFYQVDSVRDSQKGGPSLGLGLAICKAIVEAHGGTIGVESDGENGSKFWFSVPQKLST